MRHLLYVGGGWVGSMSRTSSPTNELLNLHIPVCALMHEHNDISGQNWMEGVKFDR